MTKPEHRPRAHREWGHWPPERLVGWAAQMGPRTAEVISAILGRRTHPETGRRACLGLMRMAERYGVERLEAACRRAVAIGNPRYKSVEAILKSGLDKVALTEAPETKTVIHENIRGGAYFDREEVALTTNSDEIEARYLDEERSAIMKEPSIHSDQQGLQSGSVEGRHEASADETSSATDRAPRHTVTEPLPALLGRLQAIWTRPPAAPRGEAVMACESDRAGGGRLGPHQGEVE